MKCNVRELAHLSDQPCVIEGRLNYKKVSNGGYRNQAVFKERWFRLVNNHLFYFKISEMGKFDTKNPAGVFVMENSSIQMEHGPNISFSFSISFIDEPEKRHVFAARAEENVVQWVIKLRECTYEYLRERLHTLQSKIYSITGKDPLLLVPRNEGACLWAPAVPFSTAPACTLNTSSFSCHLHTAPFTLERSKSDANAHRLLRTHNATFYTDETRDDQKSETAIIFSLERSNTSAMFKSHIESLEGSIFDNGRTNGLGAPSAPARTRLSPGARREPAPDPRLLGARAGIFGDPRGADILSDPRGAGILGNSRGADILSDPRGAGILGNSRGADIHSDPRGAGILGNSRGADILSDPRGAGILGNSRGADILTDPRGAGILGNSRGADILSDPRGAGILGNSRGADILSDPRGAGILGNSRGADILTDPRGAGILGNSRGADILSDPRGAGILGNSRGADILSDPRAAGILGNSRGADILSDPRAAGILGNSRGADILSDPRGAGILGNSRGADILSDPRGAGILGNSRGADIHSDPRAAGILGNSRGADILSDPRGAGILGNSRGADIHSDPRAAGILGNSRGADILSDPRDAGILGNSRGADIHSDPRAAGILGNSRGAGILGDPRGAGILGDPPGPAGLLAELPVPPRRKTSPRPVEHVNGDASRVSQESEEDLIKF